MWDLLISITQLRNVHAGNLAYVLCCIRGVPQVLSLSITDWQDPECPNHVCAPNLVHCVAVISSLSLLFSMFLYFLFHYNWLKAEIEALSCHWFLTLENIAPRDPSVHVELTLGGLPFTCYSRALGGRVLPWKEVAWRWAKMLMI